MERQRERERRVPKSMAAAAFYYVIITSSATRRRRRRSSSVPSLYHLFIISVFGISIYKLSCVFEASSIMFYFLNITRKLFADSPESTWKQITINGKFHMDALCDSNDIVKVKVLKTRLDIVFFFYTSSLLIKLGS